MEIRVRIASQSLCETDYSAQNSSGCVRSKAGNEMANHVAFLLNIVERLHAVIPCELVINELGGTKQVIPTVVGNYNVLDLKLNDLVLTLNRIAVAIFLITHFKQLFNAYSDFLRNKMCQRQIG